MNDQFLSSAFSLKCSLGFCGFLGGVWVFFFVVVGFGLGFLFLLFLFCFVLIILGGFICFCCFVVLSLFCFLGCFFFFVGTSPPAPQFSLNSIVTPFFPQIGLCTGKSVATMMNAATLCLGKETVKRLLWLLETLLVQAPLQ